MDRTNHAGRKLMQLMSQRQLDCLLNTLHSIFVYSIIADLNHGGLEYEVIASFFVGC